MVEKAEVKLYKSSRLYSLSYNLTISDICSAREKLLLYVRV